MLRNRAHISYENALQRAAALCARCEQCTPDILKKLSTWGLGASDAAKVIRRLEELSFVDDERFARAYAHDKLHFSSWGRRKIIQGLRVKRLPTAICDAACEEFEYEEYRAVALRVMRAKARQLKVWPPDYETKVKIIKFAMARGFEYNLVADILRNENLRPDEGESL